MQSGSSFKVTKQEIHDNAFEEKVKLIKQKVNVHALLQVPINQEIKIWETRCSKVFQVSAVRTHTN